MMKAGIPSSPADFDGRRRLVALWTSESETEAVDIETHDRKALKGRARRGLWRHLRYASAFSLGYVRRFPLISNSMRYLPFFLKEDTFYFPKIYRIFPKIIIATFMPVELVALYVCFDKPTIWGILAIKLIRPTFLKMPVEIIIFSWCNVLNSQKILHEIYEIQYTQ
jgi:hypothetical protein